MIPLPVGQSFLAVRRVIPLRTRLALTKADGKAVVSSLGTRVGADGTLVPSPGPSQRKKSALDSLDGYILGTVGSQNGNSNVRISYMAASKRSRRMQALLNILLCAAVSVASFVVYWTVNEQMLQPSKTEGFNALVRSAWPSSHPAVHRTTVISAARLRFLALECESSRLLEAEKTVDEIANAPKEATQSQAAPRRVRAADLPAASGSLETMPGQELECPHGGFEHGDPIPFCRPGLRPPQFVLPPCHWTFEKQATGDSAAKPSKRI